MTRCKWTMWLLVGVQIIALAGARPALARPGAADTFDEGLRLFKGGAYADAAKAFYAAHRANPHPDALYNAGLAWELAGEPGRAATALSWALKLELSDKARRDARKRLERLTPVLGRVEVAAPEGSTVRSLPFVVQRASVEFFFEPGRRRIEVELPSGASIIRTVTVSAGETDVVLIEMADAPPEREAPARRPKARPVPKSVDDKSTSDDERTVGWALLGAGGVASGAAIVIGLQALSARDDYDASGHRDADARDRAESLRLWTNVAWGTAAVLGATGGVFLLMSQDESKPAGASVTGAGVYGRF